MILQFYTSETDVPKLVLRCFVDRFLKRKKYLSRTPHPVPQCWRRSKGKPPPGPVKSMNFMEFSPTGAEPPWKENKI